MDKAVIGKVVADEISAATGCLAAAMNSLAGPYGKAYGRSVSDLHYACFHLASALLASQGIEAGSHETLQRLLALHFVKPAALPRDTTARLNDLMDKRHAADYKPYVPIGAQDIAAFRPWIVGFVHDVLKLIGGKAQVGDRESLARLARTFELMALE